MEEDDAPEEVTVGQGKQQALERQQHERQAVRQAAAQAKERRRRRDTQKDNQVLVPTTLPQSIVDALANDAGQGRDREGGDGGKRSSRSKRKRKPQQEERSATKQRGGVRVIALSNAQEEEGAGVQLNARNFLEQQMLHNVRRSKRMLKAVQKT